MISFPRVFFSNSENSWTKCSGSYYCFSLNLVYLVFFVRGIGHTLTQGSWKQRAIRGKLNTSKKHNYPECAASLVMRGGHMISAMWLMAFLEPGTIPTSSSFVKSTLYPIFCWRFMHSISISSLEVILSKLCAIQVKKMATRRIARNYKEMLEMTVKGTMNNGMNTKVRRTPNLS